MYWQKTLRAEIIALAQIESSIAPQVEQAIHILSSGDGKVVVTGMGKAGLIGQKVSATMRSTGRPSSFLDPAQALHGDMGMIARRDVLLAFSNSGKTDDVVAVMRYCRDLEVPCVTITGSHLSPMGKLADCSLAYHCADEGCPIGHAPMASAICMLAIGDALAAEMMGRAGFTSADFLRLHHGGYLGNKVRELVDSN